MGRTEFIALAAMLMALNALAIDIMLPGLQEIGASLGVENENHRQYVISAYLLGFGVAQLLYGPISDRFGRRKPMLFGLAIYIVSALAVVFVPSFSGLLLLRFIQGIGSAATRVITISIVRDIWLVVQVLGPDPMPFAIFIVFFALAMFQFGWIGSNFNSLAMEPLGHVAGTASSVIGFMGTIGGSLIGAAIGQAFDGTALPMVAGFFVVSIIGLIFVLIGEKGVLFHAHNKPIR
ncbi:MFS transporter [Agrobacterium sp. FDAARGOS_525]|uniref:MFS transporter n=1 Tax=Agrobacterium sp. FDAARGOS_525 TaxID=2420311 RepID=UPI000F66DD67|nr:MFS transporter [Agrobacterium sp. FDAARGOS_525]RSC38466.1 MFS transporter [Agrobacterium sp. FDAARGOS_525]